MKIAQAILVPCLIVDPVHLPFTEDLPFYTERGIRGQVKKGETTGAHNLSTRYGKSKPPHDNSIPGPALNAIRTDPNSVWDSTREDLESTRTNGYPDPWFTDPQEYYDRLNSIEREEERPTTPLELPQTKSVEANNLEKDYGSTVSELSELSKSTEIQEPTEEEFLRAAHEYQRQVESPVLELISLFQNL